MVVNFRVRGISRGARKLTRTPTIKLKKELRFQIAEKYLVLEPPQQQTVPHSTELSFVLKKII